MRKSYVVLLALLLTGAALPAAAQSRSQQNPYVPVYNTVNQDGNYYNNGTTGTVPVYNNGAAPLPIEQMIAGKNAPSYDFNNSAPASNYVNQGTLSAAQEAQMQQQYNAQLLAQTQQAAALQEEYLAQLGQTGAGGYTNPGAFAQQNITGQQQQQAAPKKRRVVYNERNNPLSEPQRLFNPDQ